ncbi:MAG: AzlC family ABC transporter permease [Chloroflexi bacterium]|nr:AzlC family ABC transporter permease [Chloroflexota bacterium]
MPSSPRKEFLQGVQAELPILLGVMPFGMIYGVLALAAGIPAGPAQAMSAVLFAGSSQFILTQLFGSGAPALVMVLTALVVNLRHALYSASLAPYVQRLRPGWKFLLAYLLTDEAYAVTVLHYRDAPPHASGEGDHRHWFYLGAGLALWTTWQTSTALGIFIGAQVPPTWSLDFTLALTFIALVAPGLKDRPSAAAALSAGLTALAAHSLPYKLGLMAAGLVGIMVGLILEAKPWKSG